MSVDDGNLITSFLRAYDLEYSYPKGIVFRTDNFVDITDSTINNMLVRISAGLYYLPYRKTTQIQFNKPWMSKDYIYTNVGSRLFKFTFGNIIWNNGSGESLTQKINEFRTRRIVILKEAMKSLSLISTNYVTAKQGNVAANNKLPGVENQITSSTELITARTTLRAKDITSANSFSSQILDEQTKLATLRKQLYDLDASNLQKNGLVDQLTNAVVQFNAQKSSKKISGDQFKIDMDSSNISFSGTRDLLKDEVVTDVDKVVAASVALLTNNNIETCISIFKTILFCINSIYLYLN